MSQVGPLLVDAFMGDPTTLRSLHLACGFTWREAAAYCLVSPETYRRWLTDRHPNPTALRLLAIRGGYVPWPTWDGWQVHGPCLFPPGLRRYGYTPGDLLAAPLWHQVAQAQAVELAQLRSTGKAAPQARPLVLPVLKQVARGRRCG